MNVIFAIVRFYPVLAIPLAIAMAQFAIFHRRRASKTQWTFWALMGVLIITSLLWIVFRGDLHSDQWVRWAFLLNR